MGDLYEPLCPIGDNPPPPPPPSAAPPPPPAASQPKPTPAAASKDNGGGGGFFPGNKCSDVTAVSQITDSAFGDAAQSAYTYQPDTGATDRKDGITKDNSGEGKRSKGGTICMIITGILAILSILPIIGGILGIILKL